MKKIFPFLFFTFYLLPSTFYLLNAREGIIILNNGKTVKGNIVINETGNYTIETEKWSVMFSKKEIKSVKYTGQEKSDSSKNKFVQKMKNTKKQQHKNIRTYEHMNYTYDPLIYFYAD
ncbi:MAG: hypothetical protein HY919_04735, partial [Elusimicrobia bacterium]|nr:hypothetical protein [Elusimicrobiota bacterium]